MKKVLLTLALASMAAPAVALPAARLAPQPAKALPIISPRPDRMTLEMGNAKAEFVSLTGEGENRLKVDCPLGAWATDCMRQYARADIALLNSGGLGESIPPGPISQETLSKAFPFGRENKMYVMSMSGADIQRMFDVFATLVPKEGVYMQVSGMSWKARGDKASVRIGGRSLDASKLYRVATIDFLATNEKSKYHGLFKGKGLLDPAPLNQVLAEAVMNRTVSPPRDSRFEK
ncbi:MAG TPA: hypothetical protein DD435_09340 [Cyanobacteria bacterium UBA8530]|nr:hypothetical protein [Cyanobacteria bacterium UBA8530]